VQGLIIGGDLTLTAWKVRTGDAIMFQGWKPVRGISTGTSVFLFPHSVPRSNMLRWSIELLLLVHFFFFLRKLLVHLRGFYAWVPEKVHNEAVDTFFRA
jgi:hypothetical protein